MSGSLISLSGEATSPRHRVDYPLGGTITASPLGLAYQIHFRSFYVSAQPLTDALTTKHIINRDLQVSYTRISV